LSKKKTTPLHKKARWDKFCLEYVKDFDRIRSVRRAGFKTKSDKACHRTALRLLSNNVYCQEKIHKLLKEQEKQAGKTANEIIAELEKIGFSNISDYVKFGPEGVRLKDSGELTREQLAAISEVSETETKDGGSTRFKLHDKRAALVDLGKRFGLFPNRQVIDGKLDIELLPPIIK